MSTVLITGASGFIGRALATAMSVHHDVLCMSRKNPGLDLSWIRGNFGSFEDLRQLDDHSIDVVIHLGAVLGGCLERDGILVNVEGTRCLMRYLMDCGCRKFVMASSIAVVGFQSTQFRPLQVPVPDEHPCLDRDGYGFSKYMMEQVTRYCHRQNDQIDVINLRLSTVCADDKMPPLAKPGPIHEWCCGAITVMTLSDALRAFTIAAESPRKPGVRVMNACGPKAWAKEPVWKILQAWYGDEFDVSYFKQPGHEWDAIYSVDLIKAELGFVAQQLPKDVFGKEYPG